jgi:uncharacterized MAPEG superfamily protein
MMSTALWCVLIAAILPLISVGIAKATGGRYDNRDPRGQAQGYTGLAKRAHAAQQNAFEAFPFFAAAVIVAELKGSPANVASILALIFIAMRVAYLACYIADKPALRSIAWSIGYFCVIGIFITPLWR